MATDLKVSNRAASSPSFCRETLSQLVNDIYTGKDGVTVHLGTINEIGYLLRDSGFDTKDKEIILGWVVNFFNGDVWHVPTLRAIEAAKKGAIKRDLFVCVPQQGCELKADDKTGHGVGFFKGLTLLGGDDFNSLKPKKPMEKGAELNVAKLNVDRGFAALLLSWKLPNGPYPQQQWFATFMHELSHYDTDHIIEGWIKQNIEKRNKGEATDALFNNHVVILGDKIILRDELYTVFQESRAYSVTQFVLEKILPTEAANKIGRQVREFCYNELKDNLERLPDVIKLVGSPGPPENILEIGNIIAGGMGAP